jgi:hypothetical protein
MAPDPDTVNFSSTGADGRKIDYYQVNATFFSALGEDESRLRLARAIQMFMPGLPQVWYLDLFAGTNDYAAAERGRTAGHKEINRTTLKLIDIETGLKRPIVQDQLELIRLRNISPAFTGELAILETEPHDLHLYWQHPDATARLKANLRNQAFTVYQDDGAGEKAIMSFNPQTDPILHFPDPAGTDHYSVPCKLPSGFRAQSSVVTFNPSMILIVIICPVAASIPSY